MNIPTPRFQAGQPVFWLSPGGHNESHIRSEIVVTVFATLSGDSYVTYSLGSTFGRELFSSFNEAELARMALPSPAEARKVNRKGVTSTLV